MAFKLKREKEMMGQNMNKNHGFTLVSALIALTIASVAIGWSIQYALEQGKIENFKHIAEVEAQELNDLARAAEEFAPTVATRDAWVDDTVYWLDVQEMIDAGLLPQGWANRYFPPAGVTQVGVSPLGRRYMIAAIRSATKPGTDDGTGQPLTGNPEIRLVVFEDGNASAAKALGDAGFSGNPAEKPAFTKTLASKVVSEYIRQAKRNDAGVIQPGTQQIEGAKGSFSYDLTLWLSSAQAANDARPAVLAGWPEVDGGGNEPPGGILYREVRTINMNNANSWSSDKVSLVKQCSDLGAGWEEIYRFAACEYDGGRAQNVPEQPDFYVGRVGEAVGLTDLGTYLNFGTHVTESVVDDCPCPSSEPTNCIPSMNPCAQSTYINSRLSVGASLGGTGEITRRACYGETWVWRHDFSTGRNYWQKGFSGVGRSNPTYGDYYFQVVGICGKKPN